MDENLAQFISHARERGMDLPSLQGLLEPAGWTNEEVAAAWCARVLERPLPTAPHTRTPHGGLAHVSPRDTFWHVLGFGALYTWVISLIVLLFQYVNLAFPDPAWEHGAYMRSFTYASIRWALAVVVVAFPLFLWVWKVLLRDLAAHPEKLRAPVRRWLTWFSLLIGAVTLVSDVITLLYFLFEGEVTVRFLLKVLALFLVTGSVCLYLALILRAPGTAASPAAPEAAS